MKKDIICRILRIAYEGNNQLVYHPDYESTGDPFEKEYVHKFIDETRSSPKIFYRAFTEIDEKYIYISIPIIAITKNGIFLEYEYYKNNYIKNVDVGIINKKYAIDYDVSGLNNYNGIYNVIKGMALKLSFILEYN